MSPRLPAYEVWNATLEYVEHIGTFDSCRNWLDNVRGLGFATDVYVIRERRRNR